MNNCRLLYDTVQQCAGLVKRTKEKLNTLLTEAAGDTALEIRNVSVDIYEKEDGNIEIEASVYYHIKYGGFSIKDLEDFLVRIGKQDWGKFGVDMEKSLETVIFGKSYDDERKLSLTIIPESGPDDEDKQDITEGDVADKAGQQENDMTVNNNGQEEIQAVSDEDAKESDEKNMITADTDKDILAKNIPLFLKMLGSEVYLFKDGDICVWLFGKRYTIKVTKDDYLSYYNMEINERQRKSALLSLTKKYLGDEIIAVMKEHQNILCEMNITQDGNFQNQEHSGTDEEIDDEETQDDSNEISETEQEPETNLVIVDYLYHYDYRHVSGKDYEREPCSNFPGTYSPHWDCEVKDIKIIKNIHSDYGYMIMANIDGDNYGTWLRKEETEQFFERDTEGKFTRRVTAEMLADYCFKYIIKAHSVTFDGLVLHKGIEVLTEKGTGPVFTPDKDFRLSGLLQKPLFGKTTIVEQNGEYFIETTINGVLRRAVLTEEDKKVLLEKDAGGEYTRRVSPFTVMLHYFGHEIQYLDKECKPECQTMLRIRCYEEDKSQPFGLLTMMPQAQTTYEDVAPSDYVIEVDDIIFSKGRYSLSVTLKKGYIKKMTNKFKKYHGETHNYYISDKDMANFLERDSEGKFTRRVTVKQLAYKYVLPHIRLHEDVIKMQNAGIPATVMEAVTCFSKAELTKFLGDYSMKRNRWVPCGFIEKKKRDKIIQQYINGSTLSELRTKSQFPDYSLLYSILKKEMNMEEPPLPKDIALSDVYDEYIN